MKATKRKVTIDRETRSSTTKTVDIDNELEKEFNKNAMKGEVSNMEKLENILNILRVTNKRIYYIPKNGYMSTVLEGITCGKFRVARFFFEIYNRRDKYTLMSW